jgi:hypothetical protein
MCLCEVSSEFYGLELNSSLDISTLEEGTGMLYENIRHISKQVNWNYLYCME